ncbi:MAG: hypothetical protein WBE61_14500 [Nitrososphaeraceae archaeon]
MPTKKLFFIYVAKNEEWQQRQKDDWDYVYSMARFYHWWIKHYFHMDFTVDADILPVIPGKLFDRMSVNYLVRDHNQRGKTIHHFYLAYFRPFWTDCQTEGYSSENFGMIYWGRPDTISSDIQCAKFFADTNCAKVSHVLSHELMRIKGKKRKEYFDTIHDLWNRHVYNDLSYNYYNERFIRVSQGSPYRFATLDISQL